MTRNSDGTYFVEFSGRREDGAQAKAQALFNSSWVGLKFGSLIVNSVSVPNCITGIDYANLI